MPSAAEIEAEAAAWLARRDGVGWGDGDAAALQAWIEASTAHRVAYLRLDAALSRADRLRALGPDIDAGAMPARLTPRWTALAAIAAAALLMFGVVTVPQLVSRNVYETEIGGRETIPLADGSRIELNTDSRVRVLYNGQERLVNLERGEAYFEVRHDPEHPFVVIAGGDRIVDLGTKFSVRRIGDELSVIVTEGRVRVERGAHVPSQILAPLELEEGAVAHVAQDEALISQASVSTLDAALSWREGYLIFRDASLADAAADFNRYNRVQLVIQDPEIAAIPIGGRFRSENLDGFVRLIEEGFPVEAERRNGEIILTRR